MAGDPESCRTLQTVIIEALQEFVADAAGDGWVGREREAVNRFVFRHLLPKVGHAGSPLQDVGQIGIEVSIPNGVATNGKRKAAIAKDLVIWPEPYGTAWESGGTSWTPTHFPLAVIEWKVWRGRALMHMKQDVAEAKWIRAWMERTQETPLVMTVSLSFTPTDVALHWRTWRGPPREDTVGPRPRIRGGAVGY